MLWRKMFKSQKDIQRGHKKYHKSVIYLISAYQFKNQRLIKEKTIFLYTLVLHEIVWSQSNEKSVQNQLSY